MCLAELNRCTAPCAHSYFHLTRPCSTGANLANCAKLSLTGWENRTNDCAFCTSSAALDPADYRLLGHDDAGSAASGRPSRANSLSTMTTSSQASARRESRRGSLARSDSSTSSNTYPYTLNLNPTPAPTTAAYAMTPLTQIASERNMQRKQRIDSYLAQLPETISRAGKQTFADGGPSSGRSRAGSTSSGGTGASGVAAVEALPTASGGKRWSVKGRRVSKML